MAAPFANRSSLRRRILFAIGGTSWLSASALGCSNKHQSPTQSVGAGTSGATDAGAGAAICGVGQPVEQTCFTRPVMNNLAKFGCGMIPLEPNRTPAEVAAMFTADGCLARC